MPENLDAFVEPWDQLEQEPESWYRIFRDYYIPLGAQRTVRNAFEFYVRVEEPVQYTDTDPDTITAAPTHWAEMAKRYEWAKRALAWDEAHIPDMAQLYVTSVLSYLQTNALNAGKALVAALANERTRVQAANSILNRIGVPEISEVNLKGAIGFTSDDMAAASEKVAKWTTQKQNPSG